MYCKGVDKALVNAERGAVSIPFKRESVLQVYQTDTFVMLSVFGGFNSLQTGKCIASSKNLNRTSAETGCFNSLQTGKCIARVLLLGFRIRISLFQFPSNGKVYCKLSLIEDVWRTEPVSIPFKRESVLQVIWVTCKFRFRDIVSIPFKRESV